MKIRVVGTTRPADVEATQARKDLAMVSRILKIHKIVIAESEMMVRIHRHTTSFRFVPGTLQSEGVNKMGRSLTKVLCRAP